MFDEWSEIFIVIPKHNLLDYDWRWDEQGSNYEIRLDGGVELIIIIFYKGTN